MNAILLMILGHLLADYTLQGWLAQAKSKSWWRQNFQEHELEKVRHDWQAALICHSLYWSILTLLPLYGKSECWYVYVLVYNVIHAVIDDLKCNQKKINLVQDQLLHLVQIVVTYLIIGA